MRKKQLWEQNMSLFNQLEEARARLADMTREFEIISAKLEALKEKLRAEAEISTSAPIQKLENNMTANRCIDGDTEYGASVIGKIVIEAARLSGVLSASGEDARELINLILGRTEVAKSDIMDIVVSERASESKKELIDRQYTESCEYFESIMAQRT